MPALRASSESSSLRSDNGITPRLDNSKYTINLNKQKSRDAFGLYRGGALDTSIIPKSLRVQDGLCPACTKLLAGFKGASAADYEGFDMFVSFEYLLHFHDCQLCSFLLKALRLEANDPMKAPAVAGHIQDELAGSSLSEWISSLGASISKAKFWPGSTPRQIRPLWPFGHGSPETTLPYDAGGSGLISALSSIRPKSDFFKDTSADSVPLPLWIIIRCPGGSDSDHKVLDVEVCGFGRAPNASMTVLSRFPLRPVVAKTTIGADRNLRYGRVPGGQIDVRRQCREWVDHCAERHGEGCGAPGWSSRLRENPAYPIRVIDVVEECIVELDSCDSKYAVLSYVAGGFMGTMLTRQTSGRLKAAGSLRKGKIAPGQTLLDAMAVTRDLGVKYLWVDRLCILHDDKEDMGNQISQMDVIYGRAFVTIVAADGPSADSGLNGVSNDREVGDLSARIINEGMEFMVPARAPPGNTLWERRAWTYQEMLLSKRLLVFSGGQVRFQCRRGILLESMNAADARSTIMPFETLDLATRSHSPAPPTGRAPRAGPRELLPPDFETYAHLVSQYTKRGMSSPGDGIRAFTGLLNLLEPGSRASTSVVSGLPVRFMDLALLWQPDAGLKVRLQRKPQFPSWSWAGWEAVPGSEGGVRYERPYRVFTDNSGALRKVKPRRCEAETRLGRLIDWRRTIGSEGASKQQPMRTPPSVPRSPSSPTPPMPPTGRPPPVPTAVPIPALVANAPPVPTIPPCPVATPPPPPARPSTLVRPNSHGASQNPKAVTQRSEKLKAITQRPEKPRSKTPDPVTLKFETETASLTIGATTKLRWETLWAEDESRGCLVEHSVEAIHETPILLGGVEVGRFVPHNPRSSDGPAGRSSGNVCKFARISEAQYFGDEDRVDLDGCCPLLNVMLITHDDSAGGGNPDVVTRAGLGRVYKWAWEEAGPRTESVILG